MSPATAQKLALAFVVGGTAMAFLTEQRPDRRYKRIWGVFALGILTAAAADFAPAVVGPFLGLVIVAYLAGHSKQLGGVAQSVRKQATTGGA